MTEDKKSVKDRTAWTRAIWRGRKIREVNKKRAYVDKSGKLKKRKV